MQFSKETIECIKNVLKVAKILKIDNVTVDNEAIRGTLQEEGISILQRTGLPKFEFQTLGLSRLSELDARLALLGEHFSIGFEERIRTPTDKVVSKLSLSNNNTTIDFKCSDPNLFEVKAPRILKDPIFFSFIMSEETVRILNKATMAMHGENLTIKGNKKGVTCKLNDVEGDMFNHTVSDSMTFAPNCTDDTFQLMVKGKILMPILKYAIGENDELLIDITQRGLIHLNVFGIDVYIHKEIV